MWRTQCFYFEDLNRNGSVVARYLTWQMASERRSTRLSLSVRWSIPVPIVSLLHSLKTTPRRQTNLNRYSAHIDWCMLRLETLLDLKSHPVPLHPKYGHVFLSLFYFFKCCTVRDVFAVTGGGSEWTDQRLTKRRLCCGADREMNRRMRTC